MKWEVFNCKDDEFLVMEFLEQEPRIMQWVRMENDNQYAVQLESDATLYSIYRNYILWKKFFRNFSPYGETVAT